MEKRDASMTVAAPNDLDLVLFFTGPPPDNKELQPYVKIEDNQQGRMKASGTMSAPRKTTVSSRPPTDLDQALKSCGAPPNTKLKPYVRLEESKGRLQARGTMCAPRNLEDSKTSLSPITQISKQKSAPQRRRWKTRKKPPEPQEAPLQRPFINQPAGGLSPASTEKLPRPPKSRIKTEAVGLPRAATEEKLSRRNNRRSLSEDKILSGRKKKAKPLVAQKASQSAGFWERLMGSRRAPSFEETLTEQLSTKRGSVKNVGCVRETYTPSEDFIQNHARYGKEQQRLSTIMIETLDVAEGSLKPSDVKRLKQNGICT